MAKYRLVTSIEFDDEEWDSSLNLIKIVDTYTANLQKEQ
jgi:hypothetical protein